MTALTDSERRVVPRWRPFRTTLELRELATMRSPLHPQLIDAFDQAKADWLERRDAESAIEFVNAAALLDLLDDAREAAEFVLRIDELPRLFRKLILQSGNQWSGDDEIAGALSVHVRIAHIRATLRNWPRDPMLWIDLALCYCTLGLEAKARRCLSVAMAIAPTNRFVLRSFTRFLVHVNNADGAMDLLRRSARTKHDPWLASAEIATSQIVDRTPTMMETGARLLESGNFSPRHITELAASLGTIEIEHGRYRKAKLFFAEGIVSPNDNVKAQFAWINMFHQQALPSHSLDLDGELDYEAHALDRQKAQDWEGAISWCRRWGRDESFSDRPYTLGSYIALEAIGDAVRAEGLSREGLRANKHDVYLLNNLAVALAMQGKCDLAFNRLKDARRYSTNSGDEATMLMATDGLVHFRRGDIVGGRERYINAIRLAREQGDRESARRAAVYFVMEEVQSGTAESIELSEIVLAKERSYPAELGQLVSRIRKVRGGVSVRKVLDRRQISVLGNLLD